MKADFDKFATEFDFWRQQTRTEWDRQYSSLPISTQPTHRLLDVGCGSGKLSLHLADQVAQVVGIDISTHMITLARQYQHTYQRDNVHFMVADIEQLGFPEQSFDVIVSQIALHDTDLDKVLPYLRGLVRPSGHIWIQDIVNPDSERKFSSRHLVQKRLRALPRLIRYFGLRAAWRITKFQLSPAWIEHLRHEKVLPPDQFRQVYARWLPGCHFEQYSKQVINVLWKASAA